MNTRRVAVIGILFGWLAAAAPAGAAPKWVQIRTKNFLLMGDAGEGQIRKVAERFEQFREVILRLFPKAPVSAPSPTVIIVFGRTRAYEPFMPLYQGKRVDVAGYFMPRADVTYITLTVEAGEHSYPIIFHEYTHLLASDPAGADPPVWFNEGIAEFYSSFELLAGGKGAYIGRPIEPHVLALRERFLPLRELFTVGRDSPLYNENDRRSIFYAQSWALVHYLITERKQGDAQLRTFVDKQMAGVTLESAVQQSFGVPLAQLERELREHVARPVFRFSNVPFDERVNRDRGGAAEALSDADAQAVLGDHLLHMNRVNDAEARLRQALTLDPRHARAHATLGFLRYRQQKLDEGRALLDKAVALGPQDYLPHYYLGSALLRPQADGVAWSQPSKEVVQVAERSLARAVTLEAQLVDAHVLLAQAYLELDEIAKAQAAIERAFKASPRHEYALVAAQIYLVQRDFAAARRLLGQLAARGNSDEIKAEARRLLGELARFETAGRESPRAATSSSEAVPAPPAEASAPPAAPPTPPPGEPGVIPVFRELKAGEQRAEGRLEEVACSQTSVVVVVNAGDRTIAVGARRFDQIDFITYRDDLQGNVACGPRERHERVYVTWDPSKKSVPGTEGEVVAVEFLPESRK